MQCLNVNRQKDRMNGAYEATMRWYYPPPQSSLSHPAQRENENSSCVTGSGGGLQPRSEEAWGRSQGERFKTSLAFLNWTGGVSDLPAEFPPSDGRTWAKSNRPYSQMSSLASSRMGLSNPLHPAQVWGFGDSPSGDSM